MGRDSRFFFITEAAYKRFDDKDIYKVDLDNDEFIEGEEFVTRNNYILPYYTVVRCEMPRTSSKFQWNTRMVPPRETTPR